MQKPPKKPDRDKLAQAIADAIAGAQSPEEKRWRLSRARSLGPNPSTKQLVAMLTEFLAPNLPPLTKKKLVLLDPELERQADVRAETQAKAEEARLRAAPDKVAAAEVKRAKRALKIKQTRAKLTILKGAQ